MKYLSGFLAFLLTLSVVLNTGILNAVAAEEYVPLEGVTAVTQSTVWSNKTIEGDLYIGPKAVLAISGNVRVTGDVYVLGALKSYGGLTVNGAVYGTNAIFGGGNPTLYNGTVVLGGTNSISGLIMGGYPVEDIPIRIDNSLVAVEGRLDINGTTINVADMYIEGQQIELDDYGRFNVEGIEIGSKKSIEIQFKTVFGNTIKKTFKVTNDLNSEPVINANNISVEMGDAFNPLNGVSATDEEDGDLTSSIEVIKNTVDMTKVGQYEVTYKVTDSAGAAVTKTIIVMVKDETAPKVTGVKDGIVYNEPVTISFNEGTATLNGEAFETGTTVSKEGHYELVVTDAAGNSTTLSFTIDKTAPVVSGVEDQGLYNKDVQITFDEGTATLNGEAFKNDSTVSDEGDYQLVVTDTAGNSTSVSFTIDKTAPVITGVDDRGVYEEAVTVTFNEGEATLNGEPIISGTEVKDPGEYELVVTDKAGNKTVVQFTIKEKTIKPTIKFTDVSESNRFYGDINYLVGKSVISGYPDGTFRPTNSVTRAEAAIMIGRALGLDGTQQNTSFSDVGIGSVASGFIHSAVKEGIIQGYPDGTFRPSEPVTRGQMAILLSRAFDLTESADVVFSDVSQKMVAYPHISKIVAAEITFGYSDNTYRPNEACTRGQFSAFLSRALK